MLGSVGAGPAQQRADAGRQLLGCERLGEVVVGAGLEPGDHVVGVGPGRHHDDRHVARSADRPAHLEAVDAGQHDVDEHDVGRLAAEGLERFLAARRPRRRPSPRPRAPSSPRCGCVRRPRRSGSVFPRLPMLPHAGRTVRGAILPLSASFGRALAPGGCRSRVPAPASTEQRAQRLGNAGRRPATTIPARTGVAVEVRRPTAPASAAISAAGGEVPRAEAVLVVGVEPAAGDRAQVDRGARPCAGCRAPAGSTWASTSACGAGAGGVVGEAGGDERGRRASAHGAARGSAGRCSHAPRPRDGA